MKSVQIHVCNLLVLAICLFADAHAQQVFKTTTNSVIGYLEYLPDEYAGNSDKYPIVIFLHGNGEKGNNSTDPAVLNQSISLVARHGPPKFVKNGYKFPFILISPQLKSNYGTWPVSYIDEVVEHVKTYLRIDESRIYVTGLSLGGGGAWSYAESFSAKIAALAPVCGGNNWPGNACRLAQNYLPVWAFHGDKDTVVPLSKSADMVNAINACIPTPVPPALLTIYAGVAHNAWDYAYRTDNSLHTPNVYEWMMSHTNTRNGANYLPKANAGSDIVTNVPVNNLTIMGTATDTDGTISSYSWKQIDGPSLATLSNTTTPNLTVSGLSQGVYTFQLNTTDNNTGSDSDYMKVTVNGALENLPPIANAGTDKSIMLPVNSVMLTGSGTDPDGTTVKYSWAKVAGPPAWLNNPKTSTLTASNLIEGTYTFRLTITDDKGAATMDDAIVIVAKDISANTAPTANAGEDKIITLPVNSVTLMGSGADAEGSVSFEWAKIEGPPAWLNNSKTATLTATNLIEGTYTFRLTVKDSHGLTSTDNTIVVVAKADITANEAPFANAGDDKTIVLPENSVTLTGTGLDLDGSITSYSWAKTAGPPAWLNNSRTTTMTAINLIAGTYTFRLTVTDNNGATGYDNVIVIVTGEVTTSTNSSRYSAFTDANLENQNEGSETDMLSSTPKGFDFATPCDCSIGIFNETGQRIYTGPWKPDLYNEIFRRQGLYIYHVQKSGQKIDSGKIYIIAE